MNIYDRQIELVEAVNNAATEAEHRGAVAYLRAWREGVQDALQWDGASYGRFLMAADWHYIEQGCERPMCCGMFNDWTPREEADRG